MASAAIAASIMADFLKTNNPTVDSLDYRFPEQIEAIKRLYDWMNDRKKNPTKYKNPYNINFESYLLRLEELVLRPSAINQGDYGLCVMATILFCILKFKPVLVVSYAIQLYDTGVGKLGDLEVKPDGIFRSQNFDQMIITAILDPVTRKSYSIAADLLMMGALRDSENIIPFDFINRGLTSLVVNRIAEGGTTDDFINIVERTKIFKKVSLKNATGDIKFKDFYTELRQHKYVVLTFYSEGNPEEIMEKALFFGGKHQCPLEFNYILPEPSDPNVYTFPFVTWGRIIFQYVREDTFNEALINYILID